MKVQFDRDKVYVIIPVYNGWEQTKRCLDALRTSSYDSIKIIVVDHGSTDAIRSKLPEEYPEVLHVIGSSTFWWAGATNLGIRTAIDQGAASSWVLLLNNDCYVAPDMIESLITHAREIPEAIVAPVQRDFETKKILTVRAATLFLFGFPTLILPWYRIIPESGQRLLPTRLILGGRGTLIPIEILKACGLFDETCLPHYGADHDFYLRCRKKGIPLFIALDAQVYVDNRKTTEAAQPENLTGCQFLNTLFSRRSHKNIRDLTVLFAKHYPIPGLYPIGTALNLGRYTVIYLIKRLLQLFRAN
jgi:GT2 family glycosyltransferase